MEKTETFVKRQNKNQPFDKRLIKKIVKLVEDGLPRREAIATYGMTKGTLIEWMRVYGSDGYQASKRRMYKQSEKRTVLRAIESGMTAKEAQIAYRISNTNIVWRWMREAKLENTHLSTSKPAPMPKQSEKKSDDELHALQQALAEAQMKIKALDTMIDIAEEQLKINIRKKSGARQSQK